MHQIIEMASPEIARDVKTAAVPKVLRVAVVDNDDHARAALAGWIGDEPSLRLVRSCPDAESALNDLPRFKPEVILLDIDLPGLDGIECIKRLKARLPELLVIVHTACDDADRLLKSLMTGADGCLLKPASAGRVLAALHEVCEGGAPMPSRMTRHLLRQLRQDSAAPSCIVELTPREQEILEQLSRGYRYKEIVTNLGISFGTLHSYISKVYEKLQVHSRTEAVVKYLNL